jgi:hypothetical protein
MRVDRILDSMPDGTQNMQPLDHAMIFDLAREKLTMMRHAHRHRIFEFQSQTQQSKSVSSLRASIVASFPQILEMYVDCAWTCNHRQLNTQHRPSLVAEEKWLFQDIKTRAPMMRMILLPFELEEILNRGVYRSKLQMEAAKLAQPAKNPLKAAVPPEKTGIPLGIQVALPSPGRGLHQSAIGGERHQMPPLSSFKPKRGIVKERTP